MDTTKKTARIAEAVRLYRDQELSMGEVGEQMGVTRECVRLWLNEAGVTDRHRSRGKWDQMRAERDATVAALVADRDTTRTIYFEEGNLPGFAARLGVTMEIAARVRNEIVGHDEHRVTRRYNGNIHSDNDLHGYLAQAVAEHGQPLSHFLYDDMAKQRGWPTSQTYRLRWGTWREACLALGFQANPKAGRGIDHTAEKCWEAVRELTAELGYVPSYTEYEVHAKFSLTAPCGATVRRRLGGWRNVVVTLSTELREGGGHP